MNNTIKTVMAFCVQAAEPLESLKKRQKAVRVMFVAITALFITFCQYQPAANAREYNDIEPINPVTISHTVFRNDGGSLLYIGDVDDQNNFTGYFVNCVSGYLCYDVEDRAPVIGVYEDPKIAFIANFQKSDTECANTITAWNGELNNGRTDWVLTDDTFRFVTFDSGTDYFYPLGGITFLSCEQ